MPQVAVLVEVDGPAAVELPRRERGFHVHARQTRRNLGAGGGPKLQCCWTLFASLVAKLAGDLLVLSIDHAGVAAVPRVLELVLEFRRELIGVPADVAVELGPLPAGPEVRVHASQGGGARTPHELE